MLRASLVLIALVSLGTAGCESGPKPATKVTPEPPKTATPAPTPSGDGALRLGAAIESSATQVALSDVAKKPDAYLNKTFATTGTVTAVCQHMGCWMEIQDDASSAHIKMAGHAFFVPKTASGRKAKVLAKLVPSGTESACEGGGHEGMATAEAKDGKGGKGQGCRVEAEQQLGRSLAKLELVADGVELL